MFRCKDSLLKHTLITSRFSASLWLLYVNISLVLKKNNIVINIHYASIWKINVQNKISNILTLRVVYYVLIRVINPANIDFFIP